METILNTTMFILLVIFLLKAAYDFTFMKMKEFSFDAFMAFLLLIAVS